MSEHLAWARWWALPWMSSHEDWRSFGQYPAIDGFYRCRQVMASTIEGIAPCLPPAHHPTVLRLALASSEQLDLALALIDSVCRPAIAAPLSEHQHLWCMRLSKALPPDMLLPDDDPLQLLRTWVEPATWQRLRLRFPCQRVLELEKNPLSLENAYNRLDTLWQAVVWRVTTMTHEKAQPDSSELGD
jgi:hypothetical protein